MRPAPRRTARAYFPRRRRDADDYPLLAVVCLGWLLFVLLFGAVVGAW